MTDYANIPGLSKAMAKKFQVFDRAIAEEKIASPKQLIPGIYLWYGLPKLSQWSWGAFFLGLFWYVRVDLIKEGFLLILIASLILGFFPPDYQSSSYIVFGIIYSMFYPSSRYAKYKLSGFISKGKNIFMTIITTVGIALLGIMPGVLINGLIYGFE